MWEQGLWRVTLSLAAPSPCIPACFARVRTRVQTCSGLGEWLAVCDPPGLPGTPHSPCSHSLDAQEDQAVGCSLLGTEGWFSRLISGPAARAAGIRKPWMRRKEESEGLRDEEERSLNTSRLFPGTASPGACSSVLFYPCAGDSLQPRCTLGWVC